MNQINIPEKNNCHISQINEFQALNLPNFVTHKNLNFINKNDGKRKFETLISEVENDDLNCLIKSSSKKSKSKTVLHFKKQYLSYELIMNSYYTIFLLLLDCFL